MKESRSIEMRLARIKGLASEYFVMEKGALIEMHTELLRIADVRGPDCATHPHRKCRIYISRMALKHFVEERRESFTKNHTEDDALSAIHFALECVPETIMDYDRHEHEPKEKPPKHFYSKSFSEAGRPSIRILVEHKERTLEIRSIHYQTRDRR